MFSGIVTALVAPEKIQRAGNSITLTLPIPSGWRIKKGDSIAIDGICTTVVKTDRKSFSVFCMAETIRKTALRHILEHHAFNLEQPLRLNDLLGGHLVSGHIDTTAEVSGIKKEGESKVLAFRLPFFFTRYIVYKGSVAVNGVSLTIVSVDKTHFTVSLIPYTLSHTNLGSLKKGDMVNIEVDMLAKYVEKLQIPVS